jgi:ParB family chromosome partitioning protein
MSSAPEKRKALGKGLSALLPSRSTPPPATGGASPAPQRLSPSEIPISEIEPNPEQPRTVFQAERLEELAQSIRANGIIQPLIVRRIGERYELVAGERRWRAAKLAGLQTVPAVVQDFAQERLLEIALIENIQREDLNPIEAAHAFDRLSREMGLSHEEIGRRTGKDRSSIANTIRLLRLPAEVQQFIADSRLPMGQARALLGVSDSAQQVELAKKVIGEGLSTRQVEQLVRHLTERPESAVSKAKTKPIDPNVQAAVTELERVLGTRVRVVDLNGKRGRIEIEYYSQDDLDRIYSQIVGEE